MILETNKIAKELPLNDEVLGSIVLYIDFITVFKYLLGVFGKKKK